MATESEVEGWDISQAQLRRIWDRTIRMAAHRQHQLLKTRFTDHITTHHTPTPIPLAHLNNSLCNLCQAMEIIDI